MATSKSQEAQEIFLRIKNLPVDEREQFISEHLTGDSELRAAVDYLLADKYDTDGYRSFIGSQLGVYKIESELGRGGMGMVYLATRTDGEFRQKVAVKLIKRGMDTDYILKRFRQERQITAALNHPNIARLFNGGTTENDSPYFVMEYIDGDSLFEYAKDKNLSIQKKLSLSLQICEAVIYAHEQRVVHRDIKPSNILVTGDGVPKLLDFGIAKILDPDLIHESLLPTATAMRLMTPEYASPEQIKGETITEASDQYSLGMVFYELLSGARPYKFASHAPHEIARVICEELPETLPIIQSTELVENDNRSPDFYLQLDRILLKSLRKHPAERYASVREFAADVERLLRGEKVHAEVFKKSTEKAAGAASSSRNAIAVLPFGFTSTSDDSDTGGAQFLSIGLADALVTRLSHVRRFLVRPTSSTLRYGDSSDLLIVGRELNVGYILSGKILSSGGLIRLSVQLLDVFTQAVIWADRFDEDLTDVLHLEDQISARVAEAVVPHLTGEERRQLERRATHNPEAYEAYLRGRFYWTNFTEQSFSQAIYFYRRAVELDPDYALAYAGIADYYIWLGVYGIVAPSDCYPSAKDAAQRAIVLDDELAEAYASLGFAQLCGDFNWLEAERNLTKATELSPNYPIARLWYSYVLQAIGRFDEGIEQAKKAVELDSLSYTNYHVLAWAYYFARRFDEAVAQCELNIKTFPDIGLAYFTQSWLLRYLKRHHEAQIASQKALELSGGSLFILLGHGQMLAAAGKSGEVEKILKEVFAKAQTQYLSYYQIALIYAYNDEKVKAIEAIERAYQDREGWLIWLGTEPALDGLRSEQRFKTILKKITASLEYENHQSISMSLQTGVIEVQVKQNRISNDSSATYIKIVTVTIVSVLLILFVFYILQV